jgi:hypothetical protein
MPGGNLRLIHSMKIHWLDEKVNDSFQMGRLRAFEIIVAFSGDPMRICRM